MKFYSTREWKSFVLLEEIEDTMEEMDVKFKSRIRNICKSYFPFLCATLSAFSFNSFSKSGDKASQFFVFNRGIKKKSNLILIYKLLKKL